MPWWLPDSAERQCEAPTLQRVASACILALPCELRGWIDGIRFANWLNNGRGVATRNPAANDHRSGANSGL
jgi:hypothetical protein